jgi:indole-3-glycerol phosphate synthase
MKGTILEKIIETKRSRIAAGRQILDLGELEPKGLPHRFRDALADRSKPNIIAEFKRASPSKGVINDTLDPAATAVAYRNGGAAAISVLTEEDFFKGSLDDLRAVRKAVDLPILRKDFVIDEFQIRESAAAGADAILLIVAALTSENLQRFQKLACELGMDAIVEVHDLAELEIAGSINARIIGVNNRNLKTFEVSLNVSRELIKRAPKDVVMIAESGLKSRVDLIELHELGYSGFLVGETLMRTGEAEGELRKLAGHDQS